MHTLANSLLRLAQAEQDVGQQGQAAGCCMGLIRVPRGAALQVNQAEQKAVRVIGA